MSEHEVLALCLGDREIIPSLGVKSGINKKPVEGIVDLTPLGFKGDSICDLDNHGGLLQAAYVMGQIDYEWWESELDRKLDPGTFGENLVLAGIDSSKVRIGDRLVFPQAELVAVHPRIPCAKIAVRMGDKRFGKQFMASGHPGFYCRVAKEGSIALGQSAALIPADPSAPTIADKLRERRGG